MVGELKIKWGKLKIKVHKLKIKYEKLKINGCQEDEFHPFL
jgi:hypothetical protein